MFYYDLEYMALSTQISRKNWGDKKKNTDGWVFQHLICEKYQNFAVNWSRRIQAPNTASFSIYIENNELSFEIYSFYISPIFWKLYLLIIHAKNITRLVLNIFKHLNRYPTLLFIYPMYRNIHLYSYLKKIKIIFYISYAYPDFQTNTLILTDTVVYQVQTVTNYI